jgi:uroporphyrinogen III methyltransferase/synthase
MMPQQPLSVQSPFSDRALCNHLDTKMGKVFLVGAGPGDPGLITLRGAECLAQADVVLFDGLANPKLLRLAKDAELICVSKHGSGPLWSQSAINDRLVQLAQSGKRVVRLKGGDPAVFARSAEELDALRDAQVSFEVVPGITAALAAASYVGIPITHRDHASAVAFVTGQQQNDPAQELDWAALDRFPGTLVFYMGVTTAEQWSQQLIAEGKPPTTPAAIVRRCSWSDQRVIRCTLADVAQQLTPASKLRPPVIVIVGPVAQLGEDFNWFESRPLHNVGVWITRPLSSSGCLERQLEELGAEVFQQPAIEIMQPVELSELDGAIHKLAKGRYQGVAFTSRNAVDALVDRSWALGYDSRIFAHTTIACVGSGTAEQLAARGLRADLVPTGAFNADSLLLLILKQRATEAAHWLLPQGDQGRDTLSIGLAAAGLAVDRVTAYRAVSANQLAPDLRAALERGAVQWVTVTSPHIARSLHALCSEFLHQLKPLSLSSAISQTLAELGWPAQAQADDATDQSLVAALLRWAEFRAVQTAPSLDP